MGAKKAYRLWTTQENEALRQWFGKRPSVWIASLLKRSPQSIRYHAWKLGLKGRRGKPWRGEEQEQSVLRTRTWLNPTVEHLAHRSGFGTIEAYLKFIARKKGYRPRGFLIKLTVTIKKLERAAQRTADWSERQWASFFHTFEPTKISQRVKTDAKPKRNYRKKWVSEGFGGYIHLRLKQLNKPASWLAREAGISKQVVHQYLHGLATPRKPLEAKIIDILESSTTTVQTSSTTNQTDV